MNEIHLEKLINEPKNGVELVRVIEILKSILEKGFSDRLHFVARTFYFRLITIRDEAGAEIEQSFYRRSCSRYRSTEDRPLFLVTFFVVDGQYQTDINSTVGVPSLGDG